LDLTEDVLQAQVLADHLRPLFQYGLIGIDNGPFESLQVDPEAITLSMKGEVDALRTWKVDRRKAALRALERLVPSEEQPVWGDLGRLQREISACWFVIGGRDDPRQKGYDVAAAAVERYLAEHRNALFFFFPIPGDEGLEGLAFLQQLAERHPEHVLVCPFIWRDGFLATVQGAAFGVMPSFYEPFGGANEFYLNGTPVVGRATGGLVQQIVPLWGAASFSGAAQRRAERWHTVAGRPTGLLFRERDDLGTGVNDWRGINAAPYTPGARVQQRYVYPTFSAMVHELYLGLRDAASLYYERPVLYERMIQEGILYIQNALSWERAAQEYLRYIRW